MARYLDQDVGLGFLSNTSKIKSLDHVFALDQNPEP